MSEHVVGTWVEWYVDGKPNGVGLPGVGNVWTDDLLADVESDTVWEAGLDVEREEPEVSLPVSQFAELLAKAKKWDSHNCNSAYPVEDWGWVG